MPSLKDLTCSIELSGDQEPLQELGTVYGDAVVETFVPVPKKQQPFTVHLSSKNFIAPGIAMYVFIDGVYQCNRNRQDMKLRKPPDRRSLVDFRVRQKEERQKDGSMIAREWTFEDLDHASADGAPASCSPNILENIGCIEVVVLRCAGPRKARTTANMNLDGAADYPDYRLDRDSRPRTPTYDDRDPFVSATNKHGPPSPAPFYCSPYAETVGASTRHPHGSSYGRAKSPYTFRASSKRTHSRYSEPVSPGTRPQHDIPAPGFQYGSGPLPSRSRAASQQELMDEVAPSGVLRGASTVDSAMLEKIVADAVKRGVEESRKDTSNGKRTASRRYEQDVENSSQIPGAWPTSPTHVSKHRSHRSEPSRSYSTWEHHADAPERRSTRSRAGTRVAWDEEPGWDKQSRTDGWFTPDDNPADSWDTEDTWSAKRPDDWADIRRRSRSRSRTVRNSSPRRASHVSTRLSSHHRPRHGRPHKSRSKPHSHWDDEAQSSSEDNDGWTRIDAPSSSTTSPDQSDSTLKPSHSRSQIHPSRRDSTRGRSTRSRSKGTHNHTHPQPVAPPQWHPQHAHSVLVTNAPTPASTPAALRPRQPSTPAPSALAPPPTWGCGSTKSRKPSTAATFPPPAPFSTVGRRRERQASGSSSWGVPGKEKERSKPSTWDNETSTWGGAGGVATRWGDQHAGWSTQGNGDGSGNGEGGSGRDDSSNAPAAALDGWSTDSTDGEVWATDATRHGWTADNDGGSSRSKSKSNNATWAQPTKHTLQRDAATANASNHAQNNTAKALAQLPLLPAAPTPHPRRHVPSPSPSNHPHDPVLAGRGTPYGHATNRPVYIDGLDKPYAVFRFKYRSWGLLRGLLGEKGLLGVGERMEEKRREQSREKVGAWDDGGW